MAGNKSTRERSASDETRISPAGGAGMHRPSSRGVARAFTTPTASVTAAEHNMTTPAVRTNSVRNNAKLKVLVRSHAMREETSPPREPSPPHCISIITSPPPGSGPTCPSSPGATRVSPAPAATVRTQEKLNGSSDLSKEYRTKPCECYDQVCPRCSSRNINNNLKENLNNNLKEGLRVRSKLRAQTSIDGGSPCLSRDSSTEHYTDCTGIDLQQFIVDTLNKNAKDRMLMLNIEQELVNLAKDKCKSHYKFPSMSSYHRMLVHRCAAYFGMDHNIETSGKCVIVNKTRNTRIPDTRFREHVRDELLLFPEEPRRSILKRDSNSFEDCNYKSPDRHLGLENRRSKSFEEREEEYEKVRRRIFKDGTLQDCDSQEEFSWADMPWPEADSAKIRLLPPEQPILKNRLLKVQSVDGRSDLARPYVSKSYSFGGYGGTTVSVLSRGDSVTSTHSAGPRLLTKQDSSTSTISWRLSPSSSGYKSQSQRSDSVTPSPTATPHQLSSEAAPKDSGIGEEEELPRAGDEERTRETEKKENQLVWAVTDMQSVPKGSVLINPQTGQPFTNEDGSIYHFDPLNPPPGFTPNSKPASPSKSVQRKSPVKEHVPSPKKTKCKSTSPCKTVKSTQASVTNSSTSPSLPAASPPQVPYTQPANQPQVFSQIESGTGPTSTYPLYPNGYVGGDNILYQPMVYPSYGMQQYESRPDSVGADLSGYFMNMSLADPNTCPTQQVGYQPAANSYWNQQPITYYQPATSQSVPNNQRYPVQISMPGQPQSAYVSSPYPPQNYMPVPATPPAANQSSSELVSVYTPPMQLMYGPGPGGGPPPPSQPPPVAANPAPLYLQGPAPVYAQTPPVYGQPSASNYPQLQSPASQWAAYETRQLPRPTQNKSKGYCQRMGSSQSSGGSSSPANTVISGYYPANTGYRQCTPPETPPTQGLQFGYPGNYVQQPMMFRPMGGNIRASPPVNVRSSRSPTPAPDYPQPSNIDRNQRFSAVGPPLCLPFTIIPGRGNAPMYKQPYRQTQSISGHGQASGDHHTNNRQASHKQRKSRSKVPALPPSGRQSNQSVSTSRF